VTSGLVLIKRTASEYFRYDATQDVHLQILMHVHPAVYLRQRVLPLYRPSAVKVRCNAVAGRAKCP
jgi:hypothetical protein